MFRLNGKTTQRALSLVLCLFMLVAAAGCGGKKAKDKDSGSKGNGEGIQTTDVDTSGSKIANKDFEGKYFKMLYRWEPGDITTRTIEAFNKEHNANIDIIVDTAGSVYETMATAIASGDPYDLVCVYDYWFPNMATQGLVVPLQDYYDEVDLYNADKPQNGGILKAFSEHYTLNGNVYAVGSAKSVYQYMMLYNKKLFNEAGLEDPYELYKAGNWNWDKFMEMGYAVTDSANQVAFTGFGDSNVWTNLCAAQLIQKTGDGQYKSCAKDASLINIFKELQSFYIGSKPICAANTNFQNGTIYTTFAAITAYSTYVNQVASSTAFDRDVANLGVVPCPIPNANVNKTYPVHASTGYAVCQGAEDPSVAVCLALFESRIKDVATGDPNQLDPEIYEVIVAEYAKAPSFNYNGFANSSGVSVGEYYRDNIGKPIMDGADVTQTLSNANSVIENMIASSLKK